MDAAAILEKVLAGRWIAGADVSDAIAIGKRLNANNAVPIFNYLGEDFKEIEKVKETVDKYLEVISEIKKSKLKAEISLKPTELGIGINTAAARKNYALIVGSARKNNVFVWLDMESHKYVDPTIKLYETQLGKGGVGICIQSYLRRSGKDLEHITGKGGIVRLVKGAYSESKRIAFGSRSETTANYYALMKYLFKNSKRFMIATHDQGILDEAMLLNRSYRRDVTYAMLNGIRNKYAMQLAQLSKVAIYVPFGKRWFSYSYRRLREEGHLTLILRSLLESQRI